MKSILINSSARMNGNSSMVCDYFEELFANSEVDRIDLAKLNICQCKGCRLCFDMGEKYCPCKDDVPSIFQKLLNSDLIIIVGPIYVEDVNGILKNLIDRMAFNCHRPGLYNQKAYILLNSGSGATGHALQTVERAMQTWGINVLRKRKIILGAKMVREQFIREYRKLLKNDAEKVLRIIHKGLNPNFIQLLTYYIQKWYYNNKMEKESFDYIYWKENGWLDRQNKFVTVS